MSRVTATPALQKWEMPAKPKRSRKRKPIQQIRHWIKRQTVKQRKARRERRESLKTLIAERGIECAIKSPACTGLAQGFSHIVGAGVGGSNAPENGEPACNACNGYCADHPKWAYARKSNMRSTDPEAAALRRPSKFAGLIGGAT